MRKIGEINTGRTTFIIKVDDEDIKTPYRVYRKYWDNGYHQRLHDKYRDLYSCLLYIQARVIRGE